MPSIALAACTTVGPDFKAPSPPPSGAAFVTPAERMPATARRSRRGWTRRSMVDPLRLSGRSIARWSRPSPGARRWKQLRARLIAAREQVTVVAGGPLSPGGNRTRAPRDRSRARFLLGSRPAPVTLPPNFNLYQVGATVSYPLDLFGGTRRAVEAQQAAGQQQRDMNFAAADHDANRQYRQPRYGDRRPTAQLAVVEEILAAGRRRGHWIWSSMSATPAQCLTGMW